MELWYTEKQTKDVGITCKVKQTLHVEKSKFQDIALIDTEQYGRMLVLDGTVQTTIEDEFVYHEMITHVPLFSHPDPRKVVVVGGGDGGAIREILKHPGVEKAYLVEIDDRVVEVSKRFLPEISVALNDKRAEVRIEDGIKFIKENRNQFDVIIVDSTDPVGPAVGLFVKDFYQSIFDSLKEDGIFVAQTESPFYNKDLISRVYRDISSIFPVTKLYVCSIPTYPSGYWAFTMGSKKFNPLEIPEGRIKDLGTKYYNADVHKAAFVLPNFVKQLLE
ncbi:MAG: Spermidine synthase [Firmicutes bacterium]|nr:Spermidine synthase [Bacillota bacterium]MDI6706362.1 polyamine aminopropyltransferase [Bacillota bacterium]